MTISVDRVKLFLWQHVLLLFSLELMTIGVDLCIKSCLGSSVISSIPYILTLAGEDGMAFPLTVGGYTIAMNFFFVICQILLLRRRFQLVQLFQLVIGYVFGWLIDFNNVWLEPVVCDTLWSQILCQFAGCLVMGMGITFEVKCGSVTMPGEGITIALGLVTGRPFAKVKIAVDTVLVIGAVACCYTFFGRWIWSVVGPGTLFAMLFVGFVVKVLTPRVRWFDTLLESPRYTVGLLAKALRHKD